MHADDDDIQLGESFIGEIELAVGEDVYFHAGEDADAAAHFFFHLADVAGVLDGALVVEAKGHSEVFSVVGDGEIFITASEGGLGHFANGVFAIGDVGVHVDVAANVFKFDECGKAVLLGGLDFAVVFAQLGRNPVEAQGGIDFFFGSTGDEGAVIHAREGVFAEGVSAFEGTLANGDVVHFGAGEVLQGCAVGVFRKQAHVYLKTSAKAKADFVLAFGDEVHDEGIGGGVFDGGLDFPFRAGASGNEDVEVADGFTSTTEGASGSDDVHAIEGAEVGDEFFSGDFGVVYQEAATVFFVVLDALAEFLYLLCTHARERGKFAFGDGGFECGDG